jgi:hypothetical protein
MLGHKSIKITQHYAKTQDRKVSRDMKDLKNKLIMNIPLSMNFDEMGKEYERYLIF